MAPWAITDQVEYLGQDLRAHLILKDIRPFEVWRLDLPGGGEGRTVADIRSLTLASRPNRSVQFLFAVRRFLGRLFGWDKESEDRAALFQSRLAEADRELSTVATGTKDGPFTVLYVHPTEAMSEIRNKTVHAALVWALLPKTDGYRLLWGIHVKPVGRLTAFYMAFIKPFRHWIVYPALLSRLFNLWCSTYNSTREESANE